jgi:microcystin-dependent protein
MYSLRFKNELPAIVAKEFESFLTALKGWIAVDHNEDGTHHVPPTGLEVPIGAMTMWGTTTAPEKWLLCDGTAYSRTDYRGLFDIIGTTYGIGDGSATFNVPNLQQRMPLGKASSGTGATLGATGGAIDHTHGGGSHGHTFSGATSNDGDHAHTTGAPNSTAGIATAAGGTFFALDNHTHTTDSSGDHGHTFSGTTDSAGGTTGTGNPPFLVVNFIICAGI